MSLRHAVLYALVLTAGCAPAEDGERRPASADAVGSCAHDPCTPGNKLASGCDPCVTAICQADPYCCNTGWNSACAAQVGTVCGQSCSGTSCSHDVCTTGVKLTSSCSSCAAAVCKGDSYCCNTGWDSQCVGEVASACGTSCGSGGGSGGASGGSGGSGGGGSGGSGGSGGGSDGPPTRQQCTGNFGSGLSSAHGRLDGYLVSIVPPGSGSGCNGDSTHVHLQVQMKGAIYDVAVNADSGYYLAENMAIPDGTWSEGWHTSDNLSYPTIGLSSGSFSSMSQSAVSSAIQKELATANHISVFGTGYNSHGIHLIHYQGGSKDGAIVINPQASSSRVLFFRFSSDKF